VDAYEDAVGLAAVAAEAVVAVVAVVAVEIEVDWVCVGVCMGGAPLTSCVIVHTSAAPSASGRLSA
jgi:hypothetical protein